jgi:hypothetical protein
MSTTGNASASFGPVFMGGGSSGFSAGIGFRF